MQNWGTTEELDPPLIGSERLEHVVLCSEEGLADEQLGHGELPLFCELVLEYQVHSVLTRIVQALGVLALGVDQAPLLAGCAVGVVLACGLVGGLVGWVVVDVHPADIGVLGQAVLVELGDLVELLGEDLCVAVVLLHHCLSVLYEVHVLVPHVHEDRWSLDHQAHIDSQKVPAELVEARWVELKLVFELGSQFLKPACQSWDVDLFFLWQTFLVKTQLLVQLLLLLEYLVDALDNLLLLLDIRGFDNSDIAGFFVVGHLWLLIIESFLLGE